MSLSIPAPAAQAGAVTAVPHDAAAEGEDHAGFAQLLEQYRGDAIGVEAPGPGGRGVLAQAAASTARRSATEAADVAATHRQPTAPGPSLADTVHDLTRRSRAAAEQTRGASAMPKLHAPTAASVRDDIAAQRLRSASGARPDRVDAATNSSSPEDRGIGASQLAAISPGADGAETDLAARVPVTSLGHPAIDASADRRPGPAAAAVPEASLRETVATEAHTGRYEVDTSSPLLARSNHDGYTPLPAERPASAAARGHGGRVTAVKGGDDIRHAPRDGASGPITHMGAAPLSVAAAPQAAADALLQTPSQSMASVTGSTATTEAPPWQAPRATSPAAPAVAVPVGAPQWGAALGQQLVTLGRGEDGAVRHAELRLDPPHLGPLRVSIQLHGELASAAFVSAHPAVRAALEAALPQLQQTLAEAGIQLGQTSVGEHPRPDTPDRYGANGTRDGDAAAEPADAAHLTHADTIVPRATRGLVDTYA